MQTATVNQNGQITIPAQIRAQLKLSKGSEMEITMTESGEILLRAPNKSAKPTIDEIFDRFQPNLKPEEFEALLEDNRSEISQ
ncbi:MAG: AbrB/MazE/SpoVT family DNA-binding domain-containing protein [Endozoicomonas sp.]